MTEYMRKVRAAKAQARAVELEQGILSGEAREFQVPPSRVRRGRVVEFVRWVRTRDGMVSTLIEARVERSAADGWLVFLPSDVWAHVEA